MKGAIMELQIEIVETKGGVIVKMEGVGLLGVYRTKEAAIEFIEGELGHRYTIRVVGKWEGHEAA
jgi:hypothetical protein